MLVDGGFSLNRYRSSLIDQLASYICTFWISCFRSKVIILTSCNPIIDGSTTKKECMDKDIFINHMKSFQSAQ